jgi:hypothetical protein
MRRSLFLDIIHKLGECSPYFTKGFDARLLAYDMTANRIYGYLKLGKATILECLEKYYEGIIDCYGFDLLHQPTVTHWYACASSNRRAYISWYVREHRLYALAVDELSNGQFTMGTLNILQSSLKLLPPRTVGSDMFFSSCGVQQRHQCTQSVVVVC